MISNIFMCSGFNFSSSFNDSIKFFFLFSFPLGFFTSLLHFFLFQLKHFLEFGVFHTDEVSEMLSDFFNQGIFLLLRQFCVSQFLVLACLEFFDPAIKFDNFGFNILFTTSKYIKTLNLTLRRKLRLFSHRSNRTLFCSSRFLLFCSITSSKGTG